MPEPGAIVGVGSSSMRMWHSRIQKDLPGMTVIPRGFGGSHYSDVIYYVSDLILRYKPRAVLIYEGDNDVSSGKSAERVFEDLEFLVKLCRQALPDLRFYVIGIKPSVARRHHWPEMRRANEMKRVFADGRDGIVFIDLAPGMLDDEGGPRADILLDDNLHLNQRGYDIWAETIATVLIPAERDFEKRSANEEEP